MALQLYNSLTRRTEEFKPLAEGRVGMYVCGPTVYGHAHLGHAKSYVSFDILVRYLRYLGYSVTYVQNITDVGHLTDDADAGEDKIAKAARKERKHPMELAEYYTRSYFEDMDKLNCVRPDISPRASGHIIEQIELVKTLIEKGFAYEVNGSVYFDVAKFPDYGKLSGRNVEEMLAGARVEVSPEKRNPADFAVWKKAEPNHIMQWPSPWGMGYPGWHLECSAMSTKYLGQTLRHPRRRHGEQVPPPRVRDRPVRGGPRRAVRPLLGPQQHGHRGRPEDGQEPGQFHHAQAGLRRHA